MALKNSISSLAATLSSHQSISRGTTLQTQGGVQYFFGPTGSLPMRLAFLLWMKHESPPAYLESATAAFVALQRKTVVDSRAVCIAIIDDIVPNLLLSRSEEAAQAVRDNYRLATVAAGFGLTVFASELTVARTPLQHLVEVGADLPMSSFREILPLAKREQFSDIDLQELMVCQWQLALIKCSVGELGVDGLLAGVGSAHLYHFARQLSNGIFLGLFPQIARAPTPDVRIAGGR